MSSLTSFSKSPPFFSSFFLIYYLQFFLYDFLFSFFSLIILVLNTQTIKIIPKNTLLNLSILSLFFSQFYHFHFCIFILSSLCKTQKDTNPLKNTINLILHIKIYLHYLPISHKKTPFIRYKKSSSKSH